MVRQIKNYSKNDYKIIAEPNGSPSLKATDNTWESSYIRHSYNLDNKFNLFITDGSIYILKYKYESSPVNVATIGIDKLTESTMIGEYYIMIEGENINYINRKLIKIENFEIIFLRYIKIDGYNCILARTYPNDVRRSMDLIYYKSQSQGMWRLCLRKEISASFFKGVDYTGTTLVHLKLQVEIEKFIYPLDPIEEPSNLINNCVMNYTYYMGEINSNEHKSGIFSELTELRGGDSFIKEGLIFTNIRLLEEFINSVKGSKNYLGKLFTDNNVNIINASDGSIDGKATRNRIIGSINQWMKGNFEIVPEIPLVEIGPSTHLILGRTKIMYIDIKSRTEADKIYRVYFQEYNYNFNHDGNKKYYNNICIIPLHENGDEINRFGLYNKIIPSGLITSKPSRVLPTRPGRSLILC